MADRQTSYDVRQADPERANVRIWSRTGASRTVEVQADGRRTITWHFPDHTQGR